jgi:hypothetical protein
LVKSDYSNAWSGDNLFSKFESKLWEINGKNKGDFYNKVALVSTTKLHLIGK